MKRLLFTLLFVTLCSPAYAQLGGLLHKAQQVQEARKTLDDLNVTEPEEIQIGQQVSARIRERFGVVQDPAITRYVTLVGMVVAKQSSRPNLPWTFIVLDTDGVNAFAAPGGIVHITRGALGLIHNEAELAGVLAHEVTHVAHKHAVNQIRKDKLVTLGTHEALKDRSQLLTLVTDKAYSLVLDNAFSRSDELDADKGGVELAGAAGYAPGALADFLVRLDARNSDSPAANGLFASHPDTRARIDAIHALAGTRTGAIVEARYTSHVAYKPTPLTQIATVVDGSAGLAGSSGSAKKDDKKADEPAPAPKKKKGFGLGNLTAAVAPESQSAQVTASGGARGVGPDRAAKGGPNPAPVVVKVTAAEIAAFKAGIR